MLFQGKHACVELYNKDIRIFKTYQDSSYAENEYFALNFLAHTGIMNLYPKKESLSVISFDRIKNAQKPKLDTPKQRTYLAKELAYHLKQIHLAAYKKYKFYITHEDLFADNLLICNNTKKLFLIDWGLSNKRDNIYPDIASLALGAFNDYPESYMIFLDKYFENRDIVDISEIQNCFDRLYNEYRIIRVKNRFEIDSLNEKLIKAKEIIMFLQKYYRR